MIRIICNSFYDREIMTADVNSDILDGESNEFLNIVG